MVEEHLEPKEYVKNPIRALAFRRARDSESALVPLPDLNDQAHRASAPNENTLRKGAYG